MLSVIIHDRNVYICQYTRNTVNKVNRVNQVVRLNEMVRVN